MHSSTLAPDDTTATPLRAHTAHHTHDSSPSDSRERYDSGSPGLGSPIPSALASPSMELHRFDVVRYRFNGRVQTGTVIQADGERAWLKTGAATVEISLGSVVSLVQPSPAR